MSTPKHYFLAPPENGSWIAPQAVVERLQEADWVVLSSEEQAAENSASMRAKLELLNAPEAVLARFDAAADGAVEVQVCLEATAAERVVFLARNKERLELMFSESVAKRRRRGIAARLAKVLGYEVVSLDGD